MQESGGAGSDEWRLASGSEEHEQKNNCGDAGAAEGSQGLALLCDLPKLSTGLYARLTSEKKEGEMGSWQVQDAKARFSEFLEVTIKKGPQVVTRHGAETAVLVPIEEWRRLQESSRPTLKSLLLGTGVRFDGLIPERGGLSRRCQDSPMRAG